MSLVTQTSVEFARCSSCNLNWPATREFFSDESSDKTRECVQCILREQTVAGWLKIYIFKDGPFTQQCVTCGKSFPLQRPFFNRDNGNKSGFTRRCSPCINTATKHRFMRIKFGLTVVKKRGSPEWLAGMREGIAYASMVRREKTERRHSVNNLDAAYQRCEYCQKDKLASREFFYANNQQGTLDRTCKACRRAQTRERNLIKATGVVPDTFRRVRLNGSLRKAVLEDRHPTFNSVLAVPVTKQDNVVIDFAPQKQSPSGWRGATIKLLHRLAQIIDT